MYVTGVDRQASIIALMSGLHRPALHAQELGFQHPYTGQWLSFTSEMPADLAAVKSGLSQMV